MSDGVAISYLGPEPICKKCGSSVEWVECWNCEDGFSHHDCGEDSCCCIDPQPNVECDICDGKGGWYHCETCSPSKQNQD